MKFSIISYDHEHIKGVLEFKLVEYDPYTRKPTGNYQLFRNETSDYHLDFFGRKDIGDETDPEFYILSRLQEYFRQAIYIIKRQKKENFFIVSKPNPDGGLDYHYERKDFPHYWSIE